MVRLLNRYRHELGVLALPQELEATANATIRQLQHDTAVLTVSAPTRRASTLAFEVDIQNLTGQLPTGYPSRRLWLHVTVKDERGEPVFESGAITSTGAIVGNDSDENSQRHEPHYEEITRSDQVQIWSQSWAGSMEGRRRGC